MLKNSQIFHLISFGADSEKRISTVRFYKTREVF